MKSNFDFLGKFWPALANIGATAEGYLYSDPNSCIYKLGMFGERVVAEIFSVEHLRLPEYDDSQAARIRILKREGLLPSNIDDILYALRQQRNKAVHAGLDSFSDAKTLLEMTWRLACWFMEVYGDWGYIPEPFVMPTEQPSIDYAALLAEREAEIEQLNAKVTAVMTAAAAAPKQERKKKAEEVAVSSNATEAETRLIIDCQLRAAGWEADTQALRYSKGTRPVNGRNMAIAEWPTSAKTANDGYADYALFIGLKLVGIIEAKRANIDVPAVVDGQCREYASSIRSEDLSMCVGRWGEYQVPFLFATNGRKYMEQWKEKSGVWFRDIRNPSNKSRALHGWMSPEGFISLLQNNPAEADAKLENTPYDLLRDPDGLNLRDYQVRAIEAAEKAIIGGQQCVLLSMATGTGKTRTVLGMIYRFLSSNRFHRILFLVDRNSLGEQAQDVFKDVKLEELSTLDNIYNIRNLGQQGFDPETRIKVATVQSMVKHLMSDDTQAVSVSDYDLIIVDEAHRGYMLDKELSEAEMLYRDQADYISKYRMVIEYFDAVKIALTATPALQTTRIFGPAVFTYSYREAVIDGFLVDHDAPHNIVSKLRQEGINYHSGEQITIVDPVTGELLNSGEIEDDLGFEIDTFNKQVITRPFNETVLKEISEYIDPEGADKTLIFAVDDDHADMIVDILRDIYAERGVRPDAIRKITGSIGDKNVISSAIREFKNEENPNIVVTVDLLTTGIDVPKITSLVFMRRVKSRILFEQMLGRATRLCPEIGKTHFEIFDPVGVYESLQDFTTMKPVSTNPSVTFAELIRGLKVLTDEGHIRAQIDQIVSKLRRKSRYVSHHGEEQFKYLTNGHDLRTFADALHAKLDIEQAKAFVFDHEEALVMLDSDYKPRPGKIVDNRPDEIISHTRGYGKGQAPQDYLDAFGEFIRTHMNEIEALHILCTRPSDLTRDALKSLRLELDRHSFTEEQLNGAWKAVTNQEITADIIAFVRQQAIGSALISHESRIKHAFARIRQEHTFNQNQLNWLARIEKTMLEEPVLDESLFDQGAYRTNGGFNAINKRFGGTLRAIIQEINQYIYDDGGNVA